MSAIAEVAKLPPDLIVPPHVPSELVHDFDMYAGPQMTQCPQRALAAMNALPAIFYTPRNGGHWVVTRQKTAVDLLQNTDVFSSDPTNTDPSLMMTAVRRIPLDLDPPSQTAYRKILNTMFSPKAVREWEGGIRNHAGHLIESVRATGKCDFLAEIAHRYPPEIFLGLLGIPVTHRDTFLKWVDAMVRSADPALARQNSLKVATLMREVLQQRRADLGDDLISRLLLEEIDGRRLDEDELIGIAVLLFIGGLDTVVALLSFIMLHLAEHAAHRRELATNPSRIPDAIEEMIRRFSISCIFRYVGKDAEFADVAFKAGDRALLIHALYGIDPDAVADPLEIDFDRPFSRHTAFGAGPHRCLGSHLARLELRVFLEEWLASIPDFECEKPSDELSYRGGKIIQPLTLPLRWPARA